jgi:predicted RND superfamily exporter protein
MGFQDVPAEATMPEEAPPAMEGFCGSSPVMTMLIVAAVFVAFTPGIMVRVGQGYGKYVVATIHGVVVALILSYMFGPAAIEGFQAKKTRGRACSSNSECTSNNCKEYITSTSGLKNGKTVRIEKRYKQCT